MMWAARRPTGMILFARELNMDLVWATAGFVGAVLVGVVVIVWVERWRKRPWTPLAPAEELERYRQLFERGELSADEYRKICDRLEYKNRMETRAANPAPSPTEGANAENSASVFQVPMNRQGPEPPGRAP
jgi:hypothetical protein